MFCRDPTLIIAIDTDAWHDLLTFDFPAVPWIILNTHSMAIGEHLKY